MLTFKVGEKVQTIRRICQGGGDWSPMEAQFFVPKDADPSSFRIQFILRKEATESVQLDDVRLQHMVPRSAVPPAPRPAMPVPSAAPAPAPAPAAAPAPAPVAEPEAPKPEAAPPAKAKDAPKATESTKKPSAKKSTAKEKTEKKP